MKLRQIIMAAAVSFALCAATSAASARYQDGANATLGIVTGPKTGTYIIFGHDIAKVAAEDGLKINVYESEGSLANIQRITSKERVGLAIVQSDVLGFLKRSRDDGSRAIAAKLRMVAPLYSEEVHIMAREDIHSLSDLAGKRVVVGAAGSGGMITAVNIFSTLGISPAKLYEIDPPRGAVAVLNGDADAMVFVGGKPVKMFKNMEELAGIQSGPNAGKLAQVHFLPVNDPALLKEYRPATITNDDYNFVTGDIPTVAVTAVLVAYDYSMKHEDYYEQQCRNMKKLAHAMKNHLDELKASGHPKWKEVDFNADVGVWKRDACSASVFAGPPTVAAPESSDSALGRDLIGIIRGTSSR